MAAFQDTTATKKIFKLKKRIRAASGGTSSSKTISILFWIIDYSQSHHDRTVHVVSESFPHLEMGAMLDFENIMRSAGYWKENRWHGTKHQYTFETGTKVRFMSVDTYGKAHGPRRDVLFVNECNNLSYEIVDQLITRTREIVWLDWNPTTEFWFYTEMLPHRDDIDFIGDGGNYPPLTYLDNEALDSTTVQEIESHKHNKRWWTVYGEGKLGEIEGRIYTGWAEIDEVPHEAKLVRYGLDFGYKNDPSALVAVYEYNGGYILDELLYKKGQSNKDLADFINELDDILVVADSSEPKSIDEIKSYGVKIVGAKKRKEKTGKEKTYNQWAVAKVQDQKISITKKSLNTIKEYRNYVYKQLDDGTVTNDPEDGHDHAMDAIKYAIVSLTSEPKRKSKVIAPNWTSYNKRVV